MKNKGISPVIATVLLIAIVVVIGLIIFMWFKGLSEETITKFGKKNIKLVCNDVKFDAAYSAGTKILSISNTGTVPIFDFQIKISKAGGYSSVYLDEIEGVGWDELGLNPGGVFSGNIGEKVTSDVEELLLIPVLRGSSKKGEKNYVCGERHGFKIVT